MFGAGRFAALAAAFLLAACATVPPLDRYLLHQGREPVRLEGARGPMSHEQSLRVLAQLKQRSPEKSAVLDRHVAVEEALTDTQLSVGNKATALEDGRAAYAAMLEAIGAAKQQVHMEMYIFEADDTGHLFAQALKARARAGVNVRLIYDSVGSLHTPKEFFNELVAAGVEVAEFNPVKSLSSLDLLGVQNRDHRKLLVVDGRIAFLGGINISAVYGPVSGSGGSGGSSGGSSGGGGSRGGPDTPFEERPWRDLQVRLEGPVVADLQRAFAKQWEKAKKEALPEAGLYPQLKPAGTELVRAIPSSPGEEGGLNASYVALISAIESAESEVTITNAYFVPHPELLAALQAAARRGVTVSLILPSKTDNAFVYHAGHTHYEDLLEAGVKIYERKSRLLHAKCAVIDGVWSTVGSTNLDWRSLAYNDELNAVILGTEFAAQMKAIAAKDIAHSEEYTLARWRDRPLEDRLKEAGARLLSYWL
jgi:cardiolipin synthase